MSSALSRDLRVDNVVCGTSMGRQDVCRAGTVFCFDEVCCNPTHKICSMHFDAVQLQPQSLTVKACCLVVAGSTEKRAAAEELSYPRMT